MNNRVPEECYTYKVSDMRSYRDAIHAGAGIGFLSLVAGCADPNLVQMAPARPEWTTQLWLVTHIALHRTAKVQALTNFLKERLVAELKTYAGRGPEDFGA